MVVKILALLNLIIFFTRRKHFQNSWTLYIKRGHKVKVLNFWPILGQWSTFIPLRTLQNEWFSDEVFSCFEGHKSEIFDSKRLTKHIFSKKCFLSWNLETLPTSDGARLKGTLMQFWNLPICSHPPKNHTLKISHS